MQAIRTKYLGPTNYFGARIKAICAAKAIIFDWNHSFNPDENHRLAAKALCAELGWRGALASGQLPEGDWAHCFLLPEHLASGKDSEGDQQ